MNVNDTTLIVVEDEIAVRRSIIGKIHRESLPLTIQGEFQNAEDAYLHIMKTPPEIILLDMRMPGMGGMKFLEVLNREFPDIQVIVLSGYSEFEYLKKAIRCGAKDYLLKPVVREDLRNSLQEAMIQARELKKGKKVHEINKLLIKENLSLVKAKLLHRLIHEKEIRENEIFQNLKQLGDIQEYKSYLFINGQLKNSNDIDSSIVHPDIFALIEKEFMKMLDGYLLLSNLGDIRRKNDFQCVIAFDEMFSSEKLVSQFKQHLKNAVQAICEATNIVLHLSISRIYQNILDTKNKYKKSNYSSLTVGQTPSLFFFEDTGDTSRKIVDSLKVKHAARFIKENNREKIISSVNKWFKEIDDEEDLAYVQRFAIDLVTSIESSLGTDFSTIFKTDMRIGTFTFYDSIKSYKKLEDIKYKVIFSLCDIAERISKNQFKRFNDVAIKVKTLIEERFQEEISLESIANQFHINKSYLSELFKKEIGLTFNKYLNWVRIEKAKELLVVHDMNAAKVSEMVGYRDQVYFSIVFKKFTGLPPGVFKQKFKSNFLSKSQMNG